MGQLELNGSRRQQRRFDVAKMKRLLPRRERRRPGSLMFQESIGSYVVASRCDSNTIPLMCRCDNKPELLEQTFCWNVR